MFQGAKKEIIFRITRESMGVPRTIGIILQNALIQAETEGENKKISIKDINVGLRYAKKMYMQQFQGAVKKKIIPGDWSATINLKNGIMDACYGAGHTQNIFEKIDKPIKFEAIGHGCPSKYCVNSSHFMSLGVIPHANIPSYVELRDRREANWYNTKMREFLSQKFNDSKSEYGMIKKMQVDFKNIIRKTSKILKYFNNKLKRGCME